MAGKFNTTVSARDMEMFQVFFDKESKRFGNSKEFKALANAFKEYSDASMQSYGPEQSAKFAQAAEKLKSACDTYTADRTSAFTSKGKERLETIRQISTYMPFWGMERAREELDHAMEQPMNEANANHLVQMKTLFSEQCASYLKGSETFRKDKVSAMQDTYREKTERIDQFRDVNLVNANKGKTFDQIAKEPKAEAKMAKDTSKAGANVSERFQATYNGKRGFFTAANVLDLDKSNFVKNVLAEERAAGNKDRAALMESTAGVLIDAVQSNSWERRNRFDTESNRIKIVGANAFLKFWDNLPDGPVKEDLSLLANNYGNLQSVVTHVQHELEKHGEERNPEVFRNSLMVGLDVLYSGKDSDKWRIFSKAEMLEGVFSHMEDQRDGLVHNMHAENYLMTRKAALYGKPERKAEMDQIGAVLADKELVHKITVAGTKAESAALAESAGLLGKVLEDGDRVLESGGDEVTLRSVGMTRVADLLGVGNIIARSERVTMDVDGKKVDGCFMEFAEGIDIESKDPHMREVIHSIDFKENPSYNRDAAKIELLDYLCGQHDRHGSNMFYKLSEPDKDGKRNIIGLQGIDNDLAFGTMKVLKSGFQGEIDTLVFVDKDMANALRGLDREKLEYAVGDLISKTQMDAMVKRLDDLQTRLKNGDMIELGPDEWNLDMSILDKYPDVKAANGPATARERFKALEKTGIDKREMTYLRGIKFHELSASVELGQSYKFLNKNAVIRHKLMEKEKDYQKDMEFEESLGKAMGEMFNSESQVTKEADKVLENIPVPPAPAVEEKTVEEPKKAVEQAAPEKAEKQKQEEKSSVEKTAPGKEKTGEKVRVSFADMEKSEKNVRKRSELIGAHRQRAMANEPKKEDKGRSL